MLGTLGSGRFSGPEQRLWHQTDDIAMTTATGTCLEPLAEVERALLVVQVLHAPHPELLGLLLAILGEHCLQEKALLL